MAKLIPVHPTTSSTLTSFHLLVPAIRTILGMSSLSSPVDGVLPFLLLGCTEATSRHGDRRKILQLPKSFAENEVRTKLEAFGALFVTLAMLASKRAFQLDRQGS